MNITMTLCAITTTFFFIILGGLGVVSAMEELKETTDKYWLVFWRMLIGMLMIIDLIAIAVVWITIGDLP